MEHPRAPEQRAAAPAQAPAAQGVESLRRREGPARIPGAARDPAQPPGRHGERPDPEKIGIALRRVKAEQAAAGGNNGGKAVPALRPREGGVRQQRRHEAVRTEFRQSCRRKDIMRPERPLPREDPRGQQINGRNDPPSDAADQAVPRRKNIVEEIPRNPRRVAESRPPEGGKLPAHIPLRKPHHFETPPRGKLSAFKAQPLRHRPEDLRMDFPRGARRAVFRARDRLPPEPAHGVGRALAAGGEIAGAVLVDIPPAARAAAVFDQPLRDRRGHVQVHGEVRPGQTQPAVLEILQPGDEAVPPVPRQLRHLVDHVGRGVAVGQDQQAGAVGLPPFPAEARVAVHGEKGGGRVGVHVRRVAAELAVQVHPHRRGIRLLIMGELDPPERDAPRPQGLFQQGDLRGLAAAVEALQQDQPAAHGVSSRAA